MNTSHERECTCARDVRLLKRYAAGSTVLFGVLALAGFAGRTDNPRFTEIDVERINIIEKDGTLRLTMHNRERAPDVIMGGKTFSRSGGNRAGLMFYNDDGDENGGLALHTSRRADGTYSAGGSIMFDQYKQDQAIGIAYSDNNGRRSAALRVWDRPDTPILPMAERLEPLKKMPDGPRKDSLLAAARAEFRAAGLGGAERVTVGKLQDKSAAVVLADGKGNARLRMVVAHDGAARIEFLDAAGRVVRTLAGAQQ